MPLIRLLVILVAMTLLAPSVFADVDTHFERIKANSSLLNHFLKLMPKGGELHYHLAGGAYPEVMLNIAAQKKYCLLENDVAVKVPLSNCQGISAQEALSQPKRVKQILQSWSMLDFNSQEESGHDHFFNAFGKFINIVNDHNAELLVDVLKRAGEQNELYLEVMILPDNAQSTQFGQVAQKGKTLAEKRKLLLAYPPFLDNVKLTQEKSAAILEEARNLLDCPTNPMQKACRITVKFQYYVLREQPLNNLFAQALTGFLADSASPEIVGVNLVQPEDGTISLRDYNKQMQVFNFLHQAYPETHIALHAGELAYGFASAKDLSFHIREALLTGQAERIGHGVDILEENDAEKTLDYMAFHHIPVEINLTSNHSILNVWGKAHPLPVYLAHHIPVVLSTDDEGILRTNLTTQYQQAVENYDLDYKTIKQINRNALTYSFMPGESLWINPQLALPVKDCKRMESKACRNFIASNPKANLQWHLEMDLKKFESFYNQPTS